MSDKRHDKELDVRLGKTSAKVRALHISFPKTLEIEKVKTLGI